MSTLTKVLERNIKVIEKNADLTEGRFRLGHHLMPPVGWLNDPNGLCWYKGKYHVFFQYAPFDVEGGLKFWGHYTSEDLVDWKYEGTALYPDSPYDCHGVYSGSALAESEKLHLFFTGNVKIDGDYDYINEGRETSTLHVESEDGIHFGDKEEIISFEKYPEEFTCHTIHEYDGEEYGYQCDGGGDNGKENFFCSLDTGLFRCHSLFDTHIDVLCHYNGIVYHKSHR